MNARQAEPSRRPLVRSAKALTEEDFAMGASTRRATGLVVAVVLAALSLPPSIGQGQEREWPGVDGASYRSPSFGYSLSWDESWSVQDAYAGPPDDGLILSNGTSAVMVIGSNAFDGDRDACVLGTAQFLAESWDEIGLAGAPSTGEDDARAWATFAAANAAPDGSMSRYTVYLECRDVPPAPATVAILHWAPAAAYESQIEPRDELLASFADAVWPGVEGASYRSPSFGYALTWDESWAVQDAYAGPPDDGLTLSNGTSEIMMIGTQAFAGDRRGCLRETVNLLTRTWDDISRVSDNTGAPLAGEDESRAWMVVSARVADPESNLSQLLVYVECRNAAPDGATVSVIHSAPADAYEDQVEAREDLLRSFEAAPGPDGN
jgi:hypothetical protein